MIAIAISPNLKAVLPKVVVGCITADVRVTQHDEGLWKETSSPNSSDEVSADVS